MTPDREKELVEAMCDAFWREDARGGMDTDGMKAALSAARPLIAREVLEDERKKFCLMLDDIADSLAFDAWKLNNSRCAAVIKMVESAQKQFRETATEHNIPLSQEGK